MKHIVVKIVRTIGSISIERIESMYVSNFSTTHDSECKREWYPVSTVQSRICTTQYAVKIVED